MLPYEGRYFPDEHAMQVEDPVLFECLPGAHIRQASTESAPAKSTYLPATHWVQRNSGPSVDKKLPAVQLLRAGTTTTRGSAPLGNKNQSAGIEGLDIRLEGIDVTTENDSP